MGIFNVDVQKIRGGVYWTNRYQLERNEPGLTPAEVQFFSDVEKAIHSTDVSFVSLRISDANPLTDNFTVYPLTGNGLVALVGRPMPGYCTMRVDIPVGFGRPCRKYYRPYVGENFMDGDIWDGNFYNAVVVQMTVLVTNISGLVDPQGNAWGTPVVKNVIQMRQLRRGTKRPLTPVIPIA